MKPVSKPRGNLQFWRLICSFQADAFRLTESSLRLGLAPFALILPSGEELPELSLFHGRFVMSPMRAVPKGLRANGQAF